jgi:hypothetical protein
VVLDPFALDVVVVAVLALGFLVVGTVLFVRRERRR